MARGEVRHGEVTIAPAAGVTGRPGSPLRSDGAALDVPGSRPVRADARRTPVRRRLAVAGAWRIPVRSRRARTGARLNPAGVLFPLLAAVAVLAAGCSRAGSATPTTSPPTVTVTSIVGTSTSTVTKTTVSGTLTIPGTPTTITHTASPSTKPTVGPPPATKEPKPVPGACPYLADADVMADNGQHTGQTSIIDVKPYPICIFTRSDGGYLATTRIVVAKSAAQAAAAVNQHVPVATSNPAIYPAGWKGGAMGNLNGVPGYPLAESIYAVSKGTIAIIAISNQAQSVKGRQMVEQIVRNLHR